MHAEMAREMVLTHNWVTPHLNGIRSLDNPPLIVWSIAASFKAFGIAVWTARIPIALFALLLFFAVFTLGRRMFQSLPAGFYAALILITSLGIFLVSRTLVPQVAICLWTTLAIRFFWISLTAPEPSLHTALGFDAACALNVLTAGLPGALIPLLIVVLFLAATRNLRHLLRWHPWTGLLLFLVITVPWHLAAGIASPSQGAPLGNSAGPGHVHGFYWIYLLNRNFLWYLHRGAARDFHPLGVFTFWALLIVWLLPWLAFLTQALRAVPARQAIRREPIDMGRQAPLLLAIWAIVALGFFTLVPRSASDTILVLPPLALLIAQWLAVEESTNSETGRRIAAVLFGLALVAGAVSLYIAARQAPGTHTDQVVPELSSLHHHLSLARLSIFRLSLVIFAAAALVGTTANLFFRRRHHARLANCFLAGMMVAILAAVHMALMTVSPMYSSRILADAIRPELTPDDLLVINGDYGNASSFSFYLARQVHIFHGPRTALWYGSFFTDAPAIFEDDASLAKQWNGPLRVFLWTTPGALPQLPGEVYLIAESGGKEIVSNQPNSGGAEF